MVYDATRMRGKHKEWWLFMPCGASFKVVNFTVTCRKPGVIICLYG